MFPSHKSSSLPRGRRSLVATPDEGMKPRTKRLIATGIVAFLVLGGGTAAFAYWSSVGHGAASSTTGASTPFTVSSSAATGVAMTPGGAANSVAFTVTNPSTGTQILSSVSAVVANQADGSAWSAFAGCSALDYTVGTPVITYGQMAPGATVSGTVSITMNNLSSNQNGCESHTVPLYITVG